VNLIVTTPLARYCGAMIVMMIVVTGAVRGEPVFSFDATPGKLPKTVVPITIQSS
jgi:aminopeptidase N